MAEKIIQSRIQFLNDTAEALAAQGEAIPKQGEPVYETDTGKLKIGDGTTKLSALKYFGGDAAQNFSVVPTEGQTDIEAINAATADAELHNGDTAIVKRTITGDKVSYTAYVYDNANWKAMDGNYSADNVYFDKDITYTVAIGTLSKPSGSATFPASGKNVTQVFSNLMAAEANPSKSMPSVRWNSKGGDGTFEIGTKKNLTYNVSLNAGAYTYGPATGITATSWSVVCDGVTKTTATGTFENVVAEATAKSIAVTANYTEGAVPVTNLGNPYPEGKIAAGSCSSTNCTLKGVRHMFYGCNSAASFTIDSASIRTLNHEAVANKTIATFSATADTKRVVVAVPSDKHITKVLLPSAMNADCTADFVLQSGTTNVEGAEGYTAAAYNVYIYEPASIPAGQSYSITIG